MSTQLSIAFLLLELVAHLVLCSLTEQFQGFKNCLLKNSLESSAIVTPNSSNYANLNFRCVLRDTRSEPLAFVLPQNETEVELIVRCGTKWKTRLVTKGGGHSFESYSFGDNNSVIVDMRRMNYTWFDLRKSETTIEAGALTGPVAIALWTTSLFFIPIDTCATVGIAGLSTGGGVGFFSRSYGLTLDYIVGMSIITANGRLVTANRTLNPNLFWALRGGGAASFGILTKLVFSEFKGPLKVYVVDVYWPMSSFVDVLTAWQALLLNGSRSLNFELVLTNNRLRMSVVDVTGNSTKFRLEILKSFPSTGFIRRELELPYIDAVAYLAAQYLNETGVRTFAKLKRNRKILYTLNPTSCEQRFEKVKSFYIEKLAKESDLQCLYQFCLTMPPTMWVKILALGGAINKLKPNETAYVHRSGRLALATARLHSYPDLYPKYRNENEWTRKFIEFGQTVLGGNESYQNYVDAELPDYLKRYYGENLERLVKVKKIYDPENYFNNPQSIPTSL